MVQILETLKSSILDLPHVIKSYPVYAAVGAGVGFVLFCRTYAKIKCGVCNCNTSMEGKTIIVTGGNAGIGKETARVLAKLGAKVILACRNPERGQQAVAEIRESTGNRDIIFHQLDLGSFDSVRNFVRNFLESEHKLDILINNAGIYAPRKREVTVDGCEVVMQSNHLGHFLLTNLLLDLIKKSAPSRIVNLASGAYANSEKDLHDIQSDIKYSSFNAYAKSKLANVLFTRELAKRLKGTGVTVNAVHPGVVKTGILKSYTPTEIIVRILFFLFGKTPLEGAQTTIHVACSEELEKVTGKYFSDCKEEILESVALDDNMAISLWTTSERIVGL